jgi:hypothetical protein
LLACLLAAGSLCAVDIGQYFEPDEQTPPGPPPTVKEVCLQTACGIGGMALASGFAFTANASAARYLYENGGDLVGLPAELFSLDETTSVKLGTVNFTYFFATLPSAVAIGVEAAGRGRGDATYAQASALVGSLVGLFAGAGINGLFPAARSATTIGYVGGALVGGLAGYNLRRWTDRDPRSIDPRAWAPDGVDRNRPDAYELWHSALGGAEAGAAVLAVKYGFELAGVLGAHGRFYESTGDYLRSVGMMSYPAFVTGGVLISSHRYYEPVNPALGAALGCLVGCVVGGAVGELFGNGDIGAEVGFHVGAVPGAVLGYYWRRLF